MAGPFKLDNQYANYAGHWLAATAYAFGKRVIAEPTNVGDARKYVFECTTAGTSADPGPPTWVITPGNTTPDGTVTWTCREATTAANAHGIMRWICLRPAAGETLHIGDDHTETSTITETWTFNGTVDSPVIVICMDKSTDNAVSTYPALPLCDNSGGVGDINIYGVVYFWGVHFKLGNDFNLAVSAKITIEKSKLASTYSGTLIEIKTQHCHLTLIDVVLDFANSVTGIFQGADSNGFIWRGGSITGDLAKLVNFSGSWGENTYIEISGVDLSPMIDGAIIYMAVANTCIQVFLSGIKLNASPPDLISGNALALSSQVLMDIADNGNTVYKFRREYPYGYAQDETSKVITGKALYDGTNEFTAKMVSRATPVSSFFTPWRYHLTTLRESGFAASRTYTVHIAQDHASVQPDALDNDEIWLEVVYPDNSTAQYNIKTDKIATPTTTPAAQTASTESWEGLAATTRLQKLEVQIDAADGKNGPVEIWVCLAKESKTVYICPEVYVS